MSSALHVNKISLAVCGCQPGGRETNSKTDLGEKREMFEMRHRPWQGCSEKTERRDGKDLLADCVRPLGGSL